MFNYGHDIANGVEIHSNKIWHPAGLLEALRGPGVEDIELVGLGGPFFRGYDKHIEDDRCDSYLPVMWMAFGLGEPDLGEGVEFAADAFEPDPIICALAAEAASRPVLNYRGLRHGERSICYYNTPHISMGSMKAFGYSFQSRFFNVMFAADPSKSLRTYLRDEELHTPWDQRNERGELVQYKNWLISRGALVEEGGIAAEKTNGWDLYRVGKGLCAHLELPGDWHVFQVSDLDIYPAERAFLEALSKPVKVGTHVQGKTTEDEQVSVELSDMSLTVNGHAPKGPDDMLHDCQAMRSKYGSGIIEIRTEQGQLTVDNKVLLESMVECP